MTSIDTARAVSDPFGDVGGRFMLSGRTYERGSKLGFAGIGFYFSGRAGVLGAVEPSVVVDELGFFEPGNVTTSWLAGLEVMSPGRAAGEFITCGYDWGRARLPDDLDGARLAQLVRRVVDATGDDQPALFAGWRAMPWPDDDRAAALHAIHLMRELRGGAHLAAVHRVGIDPHAAVMVRGGEGTATFFGWPEPHPDPEAVRELWETAEAATDEHVAAALEVLDDTEQAELVDLARSAVPQ